MSRYTSMIALYGISLPHKIAKKIYQNYYNHDWEAVTLNPSSLDEMDEDEVDELLSGISRENSPYRGKGHGNDFVVFNLAMLTHSENFYADIGGVYEENPNIPHYFGIVVADSGAGDKVSAFTNSIPQEAIDNFKKYAVPILDNLGIANAEPKLEIIQQNC